MGSGGQLEANFKTQEAQMGIRRLPKLKPMEFLLSGVASSQLSKVAVPWQHQRPGEAASELLQMRVPSTTTLWFGGGEWGDHLTQPERRVRHLSVRGSKLIPPEGKG